MVIPQLLLPHRWDLSSLSREAGVFGIFFWPDYRIKHFLILGLTDGPDSHFYKSTVNFPGVLSCCCFTNINSLESADS